MLPVLEDPLLAQRAGEQRLSRCVALLKRLRPECRADPRHQQSRLSGNAASQISARLFLVPSKQNPAYLARRSRGRNETELSLAQAREMRAATRRPRMKMTSAGMYMSIDATQITVLRY